jgi:hypothetical protein
MVGRKSVAHSAIEPSSTDSPFSPALAGLLRLAPGTDPPGRIKPARDTPAKRGMRPIHGVFHKTVLYRVEMRVAHVGGEILVVTDRMLPVPPLPDAAFAAAGHGRRSPFADGQSLRERGLDRAPTTREVGVVRRQCPQAVHVVGKDDPGVDVEGSAGAHLSNRVAQRVDPRHQQIRLAVEQVDREEKGPPGTRLRR